MITTGMGITQNKITALYFANEILKNKSRCAQWSLGYGRVALSLCGYCVRLTDETSLSSLSLVAL